MAYELTHRFHSRPMFGGSLFTGDTIEITDKILTLRRNHLFLREFFSISIPLTNIINVKVVKRRTGADIMMQSQSQNIIVSRGYRFSIACKMRQLIQQ